MLFNDFEYYWLFLNDFKPLLQNFEYNSKYFENRLTPLFFENLLDTFEF